VRGLVGARVVGPVTPTGDDARAWLELAAGGAVLDRAGWCVSLRVDTLGTGDLDWIVSELAPGRRSRVLDSLGAPAGWEGRSRREVLTGLAWVWRYARARRACMGLVVWGDRAGDGPEGRRRRRECDATLARMPRWVRRTVTGDEG
jgi:hypothetical protein